MIITVANVSFKIDHRFIKSEGGIVVEKEEGGIRARTDDGTSVVFSVVLDADRVDQIADEIVDEFRSNRIPARLKSTKLVECGCCDHFHPVGFAGDCRDDGNRFVTPNDHDDVAFWIEDDDVEDDGTPNGNCD